MTARPRAEPRCPLCGGPNGCVPAATGTFEGAACWCRDVTFSAELLARVPAGQQGRACICRRCATEGTDAASGTAAASCAAGGAAPSRGDCAAQHRAGPGTDA